MNSPSRTTSFGEKPRAAACFALAPVLGGLAALFFWSGSALFAWAALVPAFFAALLVYSGLHALFASANPPTTLSGGKGWYHPGEAAHLEIVQQGPILLESLRVNLVCERSERKVGSSRQVTYPCQDNLFDSGPAEIPRLGEERFRFTMTVPSDAELSSNTGRVHVSWRLEVWGKVRGRADFMRPFDLEVRAAERDPVRNAS